MSFRKKMAASIRRNVWTAQSWLIVRGWSSHARLLAVAKTHDEYKVLRKLRPDSPPDSRILKVALMGASNAGKSTLMNALMGRRVSSVSKTFHTTQRNTTALLIRDAAQVVLLDTPGLFASTSTAQHDVDPRLRTDAFAAVDQADIVAVLVDAGNVWTRSCIHKDIVATLKQHKEKPSILILNKVDLVKTKSDLLILTRSLTGGMVGGKPTDDAALSCLRRARLKDAAYFDAVFAKHNAKMAAMKLPTQAGRDEAACVEPATAKQGCWPHFSQVFMLSSLNSDGVADLQDYLCEQAKPGQWLYHSSFVTDQDPQEILDLCLREAFLEHLPQEVPFRLGTDVFEWEEKDDGLNISLNVLCRNKGTFSITMGKGGTTLRAIAVKAEKDLSETFGCNVTLKLGLKLDGTK